MQKNMMDFERSTQWVTLLGRVFKIHEFFCTILDVCSFAACFCEH